MNKWRVFIPRGLQLNPIVKLTLSRRSLPSQWRCLQTSFEGAAKLEAALLAWLSASDWTTVDVGDSIPSRTRICLGENAIASAKREW